MGQGRIRLLIAMAAVGMLVLAVAGNAGAARSCGSRVLSDWQDGRLDSTYPVKCYRQALAHLPEDVQVYSSAQADITRALQVRLAASPKVGTTHHSSAGVSPLLVVVISAAVLVAAGSVAAAVR